MRGSTDMLLQKELLHSICSVVTTGSCREDGQFYLKLAILNCYKQCHVLQAIGGFHTRRLMQLSPPGAVLLVLCILPCTYVGNVHISKVAVHSL